MNKRFLLAWLIAFVLWMAGSFLVHHTLLQADYASVQNLFRTPAEAQQYFPWMILAHVLMAGALVWIYSRGVEAKPWVSQGLRFGVAIALLTVVPWYMIYYVVQPLPGTIVVKQIVGDTAIIIAIALVTAWIYRSPRT
jgi:hypothetical protein